MKRIQVLGPGCPNCERLSKLAQQAAIELCIEFSIEKVTDIQEITGFGVMMTPALVVDGAVKIAGKVPSVEELKKMLV